MPFSKALFGFQGRLGRMAFFGYICLMVLLLGVVAGVGAGLASQGGGGAVIGALMLVAAGIGYCWMLAAVYIKRLHDLDMAGSHLIWIIGSSAAGIMFAPVNSTLSVLFTVFNFMVGLWLLFAPGTLGPNRFGQKPGTVQTVLPGTPGVALS